MMSAGLNDLADVSGNMRWYAVNTLPHREFKAKYQLENQGYRIFLPQRLKNYPARSQTH